ITEKPPQGSTAEENVARFESLLKTLRKQRRKIVWTVHNILPHDTRNRELAVRARELMTEYAHAIHIMSARTVELCAPLFQLDGSKVFHCPHPSYMGAYPDHIDRIEARFRLGLEPDSIVFLSFGAIQ